MQKLFNLKPSRGGGSGGDDDNEREQPHACAQTYQNITALTRHTSTTQGRDVCAATLRATVTRTRTARCGQRRAPPRSRTTTSSLSSLRIVKIFESAAARGPWELDVQNTFLLIGARLTNEHLHETRGPAAHQATTAMMTYMQCGAPRRPPPPRAGAPCSCRGCDSHQGATSAAQLPSLHVLSVTLRFHRLSSECPSLSRSRLLPVRPRQLAARPQQRAAAAPSRACSAQASSPGSSAAGSPHCSGGPSGQLVARHDAPRRAATTRGDARRPAQPTAQRPS